MYWFRPSKVFADPFLAKASAFFHWVGIVETTRLQIMALRSLSVAGSPY
jgi:hypothetical protein